MKASSREWISKCLFIVSAAAVCSFATNSPGDDAVVPVASDNSRQVSLHVRQSKIIDAPWPIARVAVTDPAIADVQMLTARKVLLQGKAVGSTDLIMWSKDEQIWETRVDVSVDLRRMKEELTKLFPYSRLKITQVQDIAVISGTLNRAEQAAHLHKFLEATNKATELQFINMTSIAGVQQVLLKVRIAEVSRTAMRVLGINMFNTNNDYFFGQTVGSSTGGAINPINIGVAEGTSASLSRTPFFFNAATGVSPSVTLFAGFPEIGLQFFMQALAENQYLRLLAEPTLVALSGQEASFMVGGEFPVPVVQGSSATGGGSSVTIEWKQFGVLLNFRPTVLGDGSIRLHLAPEVSELSDVGAVIIQGFQIPSVIQRKVETTLELKSGQTFAMAGLLRRVNSATSSRIPGLGDIPILGALFRSVRYRKDETDLVILVTASLVEPMNVAGELPVPGDSHVAPNDWELYALGRIEGKTAAKLSRAQKNWLKKRGLNRLKGPGAWASYDSPPARSSAEIETVSFESQSPAPAKAARQKTSEQPTVHKDAPPPAAPAQPKGPDTLPTVQEVSDTVEAEANKD